MRPTTTRSSCVSVRKIGVKNQEVESNILGIVEAFENSILERFQPMQDSGLFSSFCVWKLQV